MGLNDLMHPRNKYKDNPPDFNELAAKYPEFKKFARETSSGNVTINFKDPEALRALTCSTLDHDFGLKLELPLDRLIPTVPLRLNYILWLEDLLECLPSDAAGQKTTVWGVDIGTGSSCIYPLLGTCLDGWHFIATEIDEETVQYALKNVSQNGLEDKIKVKLVTPDCYLQKPLADIKEKMTFCMCNPPFFSSEEEAALGASRTEKRPLPSSVCTGTKSETVTRGGEAEFVKGIIDDSLLLKEKVSWYTTMLGKKSSVLEVIAYLKKHKIYSIKSTLFCQGKTRRWGVAWTFLKGIIKEESPPAKRHKQQHKAKPLEFTISCCQSDVTARVQQSANRMRELLTELKINFQDHQIESSSSDVISHVTYLCTAMVNTWSNQRRKRRQLQREERASSKELDPPSKETSSKTGALEDQNRTSESKDSEKHRTEQETLKPVCSAELHNASVTGSIRDAGCLETEDKARIPSVECKGGSFEERNIEGIKKTSSLCVFSIRIEPGLEPGVRVGIECREGDKNQVYQIYQFLQNKMLKGL